jgi:hypothetical protein
MEAMGPLPQRTPMGHRPRELQRQRRCLELLHARPGPVGCVSLGEDGLAGFSDDHQRLCFALTLWNGKDPILKQRRFGLTNSEGNHGEDVKEYYFYLDSTPTHSYMKYLYKYPQNAYPYNDLVETNRRRGRVEYAKASPTDILIQISVGNPGPDAATLHVLPALWFRNTWTWWPDQPKPSDRSRAKTSSRLKRRMPSSAASCCRATESAPAVYRKRHQ